MAARRCSLHGIDFPTSIVRCPICNETTDWMNSVDPDDDWEHEVEVATRQQPPPTEADRVERWRIQYALDLGYDPEIAVSLAVSDADMHRLERLIRDGCSLELASRIV